jgi:hypothetical protein
VVILFMRLPLLSYSWTNPPGWSVTYADVVLVAAACRRRMIDLSPLSNHGSLAKSAAR